MAITRSTVPTSQLPHVDRQAIESLLENMHFFEPAVLEEDMDFHRMRAVVRLKRKLVTGDVTGAFTQEKVHQPIFECPVHHWKNTHGLNRVRYLKGNDVTVIFSHRAKDMLVKDAHRTGIDPKYKRAFHEQDAFVLLGFMCDHGEPLAPKDRQDELGVNHIWMSKNDWVHYWGRAFTNGWGTRMYTTPAGDHFIHPRIGRDVWLEENARWKILFAEPCAYDSFNPHLHVGSAGPAVDGPPLVVFHFIPMRNWSPWHHVDLPTNF